MRLPLSEDGIAFDHVLGAANYRSLRADEARGGLAVGAERGPGDLVLVPFQPPLRFTSERVDNERVEVAWVLGHDHHPLAIRTDRQDFRTV